MTRQNHRRGSALIEFAGSLILLSVVFTGIFQIGYSFFAYNTLVNAVRSGARYASRSDAATPQVTTAVRNLVVYGDLKPASGAKPVIAGLATDQVDVRFGDKTATVSVRGFELDSLFSKWKLDGRPTVTFPLIQGAAE